MPRKYTVRSKEEKLSIVKAVLSGTPAKWYENERIADHHTVMNWVKSISPREKLALNKRGSLAILCPDMNAGKN